VVAPGRLPHTDRADLAELRPNPNAAAAHGAGLLTFLSVRSSSKAERFARAAEGIYAIKSAGLSPLNCPRMLLLAADPQTVRVVVDHGSAWPPDSGWFIFSTIAAACAAIATSILALLTGNLARATGEIATKTADLAAQTARQVAESIAAIEQTERHHQQSMMPLVYLLAVCHKVVDNERVCMRFAGKVVNIGPGPSVSVNALLKPSTWGSRWVYLGLIAANTQKDFAFSFQLDPMPFDEFFPYHCLTRFRSVFDTEGFVHQESHSGEQKDIVVRECFVPSKSTKTLATRCSASSVLILRDPPPERRKPQQFRLPEGHYKKNVLSAPSTTSNARARKAPSVTSGRLLRPATSLPGSPT
jgi:hypothetical protein